MVLEVLATQYIYAIYKARPWDGMSWFDSVTLSQWCAARPSRRGVCILIGCSHRM